MSQHPFHLNLYNLVKSVLHEISLKIHQKAAKILLVPPYPLHLHQVCVLVTSLVQVLAVGEEAAVAQTGQVKGAGAHAAGVAAHAAHEPGHWTAAHVATAVTSGTNTTQKPEVLPQPLPTPKRTPRRTSRSEATEEQRD